MCRLFAARRPTAFPTPSQCIGVFVSCAEVTTSYRGCYGRVTNDSTGGDAHAENVGYIGVVWARVPSVVGLSVVR